MIEGISKATPPETTRSRVLPSRWHAVAEALREDPGEWYLVAESVNPSMGTYLRRRYGLDTRLVKNPYGDGRSSLYARFVPDDAEEGAK